MSVTAEELTAARAAYRRDVRPGAVNAARYRLRYFTWGGGPPLVFVHGMAGGAEQFAMVMQRLVDRFTCIGYELPDGLTDGSTLGRYTLADYAADLLALLDHLGFGRTAVLGSSFGSTITLAALAAAPDRFTRGILQGGLAHRPLNGWECQAAQLGRFLPGWFGDWPAIYRRISEGGNPAFRRAVPPAVWEFFLTTSGKTTNRAAALRGLTIARTDLQPVLPTIRTPLLLIGGDRDELVPRPCERQVEMAVPGAVRVELPGCGHYPQFTHPGEMAAAIRQFLGEPVSAAGSGDPP